MDHYARFTVVQIIALAVVTYLYIEDILFLPFQNEGGWVCYVIVGNAVLALIAMSIRNWRWSWFLTKNSVRLGILGTIIGLIGMFRSINPSAFSDPAAVGPMLGNMLIGFGLALFASLLGMGLNGYLHTLLTVLKQEDQNG